MEVVFVQLESVSYLQVLCTPRRLPSRYLLSECHTVSRYTRKFNLIYALKKNTALTCAGFLQTPKRQIK